jgi:hypothetical protein
MQPLTIPDARPDVIEAVVRFLRAALIPEALAPEPSPRLASVAFLRKRAEHVLGLRIRPLEIIEALLVAGVDVTANFESTNVRVLPFVESLFALWPSHWHPGQGQLFVEVRSNGGAL